MPDELSDLEQQVQDQFSTGVSDPPAEPEEPEASSPPSEPPAPPTPRVKVKDAEYDEAELQSLIEFQQWAKANQDRMAAFAAYLQGEADFVPKSGKPQPQPQDGEPEDPYAGIDDPAIKEKLQQYDQRFAQLDNVWQAEQQRQLKEAEGAVTTASQEVAERYNLDEEGLQELQKEAAALGIVPSLRAQTGDMRTAVERALEIAYWQTPKFRDQAIEAEALKAAVDIERKAHAGKITGTSGGTGRNEPANVSAMSEGDKRSAIANMIREAQEGTIQ